MRIHHFYPRTRNIGDHFVQRGIEAMIRRLAPAATFTLFDVNSRGRDKTGYGLTQTTIARANRDADLIIVGGSNLYEGGFRWPWGVHLEVNALKNLQVPLFLLGLGTGSDFDSPAPQASTRAEREIKLLNECATLSGVRDVTTLEWLQRLGVGRAKLMGDPANFIYNHSLQSTERPGHVLVTVPPRRLWHSKRQFWKVHTKGRAIFSALAGLTRTLLEKGEEVVITCNDPLDLPVAQKLFDDWQPRPVVCPETPESYLELLANSRAVISGRLHTTVAAFSLGIPFLLLDIDQRTHGFVKTYGLEAASVVPSGAGTEALLNEQTTHLLSNPDSRFWPGMIEKRDRMYGVAMTLLEEALRPLR